MAAAAAAPVAYARPVAIMDDRLISGSHSLPMKRATSFCVTNKNGPDFKIEVQHHNGPFSTNYQFAFKTIEELHDATNTFLDQATLRPHGVFSVRRIMLPTSKMIPKDTDSRVCASVTFEFHDEANKNFFMEHAMRAFPSDFSSSVTFLGSHYTQSPPTVTVRETSSVKWDEQWGRIQTIFNRLKQKFGDDCIKQALIDLKDDRFHEDPYPAGGAVGSREERLAHHRDIQITPGKMTETISVTAENTVSHDVSREELEEWLERPEAQVEKRRKEREAYFGVLLQDAINNNNAAGVAKLTQAASAAGIDLVWLFATLTVAAEKNKQ
jgi:hypothetical protein